MTITLTRLTTKTTTTEAVVEYKTVEKTDPNADAGLADRADQGRDRAAAGHHRR